MSSLLRLFNYPTFILCQSAPVPSHLYQINFYWLYSKRHSLINSYFHPWRTWCSWSDLTALTFTVRRCRDSVSQPAVEPLTCPLRWSLTDPAGHGTVEKSQKGKESSSTSSHVSHSDETLSLIVITTECQVSDSQPTHHANISVHSALECDGILFNFPSSELQKRYWETVCLYKEFKSWI